MRKECYIAAQGKCGLVNIMTQTFKVSPNYIF